ncbi:hypothetical protein ALC56_07166 [Trachymyrmex septentrionalis]|uniref:Uncharacterized protein n=1 Tax=Trachymyrmex septentrionalis TaxID=34720 RepID=A0A151JW67_9HYME|nr:hypothetical protein ALC56_07166 [Trachymyrmex septentrionalis]
MKLQRSALEKTRNGKKEERRKIVCESRGGHLPDVLFHK